MTEPAHVETRPGNPRESFQLDANVARLESVSVGKFVMALRPLGLCAVAVKLPDRGHGGAVADS